jgi:MFS family permease
LVEDAGEEEEEITVMQSLKMASKDYRVWLCVLGQMSVQAVASLTNFLPTLVKSMGYGTIETLLLTAPPYILTAIFCVFNLWYSDRTGKRSPHIYYPSLFCMAGIIITIATTNVPARYFALFLMLPGAYGCFQVSNAWMANIAARPQKKRAIALALNNSIGNTALVWTPYLYPKGDGPKYTMAWSVNLGLTVVTALSALALSFCLQRENKKMDEMDAAGYTLEEGSGDKAEVTALEREGTTAGRRLGGVAAGRTARYDI